MAPRADYHESGPRGKKPVLAVLGVALALIAGSVILFPYLVDDTAPPPDNPKGSPPVEENEPPAAAFTYACDGLDCSFDASESDDPDGVILVYRWNFGDGATDDGAVVDHTYDEGGTYTVTLTVVDDEDARDALSQDVQVEEPPPPPPPQQNQPPNAYFTDSCQGRTCTFDGSGSTDPDGNITSYAWSLGDGNSTTGAVVSHTYAAPGIYDVTLTVTDDKGATDAYTWQVIVQ